MPNQFVVPQFIDVEDKIIGSITVKQFIMGIVVFLFIFLAYKFADLSLFIVEAVFLFGFYVLIAFVKVNGQPFYYYILNVIRSLKRPALRLWSRDATVLSTITVSGNGIKKEAIIPIIHKKLVERELSSVSLLVDTGGRYRPEEILRKSQESGVKSQK